MNLRWVTVVVGLAVVIGLAVVDLRADNGSVSQAASLEPRSRVTSAVPGTDAGGGVWYCPGGTSTPGELADLSLVVANPTSDEITAKVSVFGSVPVGSVSAPPPVEVELTVPAASEEWLRLADVVEARYAAALVEVSSGLVVVEQWVRGPTGTDVTPCATQSSEVWHFAAGSTRRDARLVFTVFNPLPYRAVVRFTFATDGGVREPDGLQGVLVPARSVIAVNVTDLIPRFDAVATTVESLVGRVVAGRLQAFNGTEGLEGLAAGPGIPQPQEQWLIPSGRADEGVTQSIMLYNPSSVAAEVDIAVQLDVTEQDVSVAPITLTVPPKQQVAVVFGDNEVHPLPPSSSLHQVADLVLDQLGFWSEVRVFNGVPLVVEQMTTAPSTSPSAGIAITAAMPVVADWHLVAGNRADQSEVVLAIANPSPDSIVQVTVSEISQGRITPVSQLSPNEIGPRDRLILPVDQLIGSEAYALLIETSRPVAVTRFLLATEGTGLASGPSVVLNPEEPDPLSF